jgi:hypothetical protein
MAPLLNTFAGLAVKALGFTRGSNGVAYFIAKLTTGATVSIATGIATFGSKVYLAATDGAYSPFRFSQTRLTDALSIDNSYGDSNSTGGGEIRRIHPGSAGESFIVQRPKNQSSWASIIKTNANGTIAWERNFTTWGNDMGEVATAANGDVYFGSNSTPVGGSVRNVVVKYNSSGTIQWQRFARYGWTVEGASGMAVNPTTGDVYKGWSGGSDSSNTWPFITKWDASGTHQWTKSIPTGNVFNQRWNNMGIDADGNIYIAGLAGYPTIIKLNSSGVQQWARTFTLSGGTTYPSLAVDNAGNSYMYFGVSNQPVVVKYNSSGAIQWQRGLTTSFMGYNSATQISADANSISFVGSSPRAYFFRFPADGTKTGTHVLNGESFTWAATSGTDSAYAISFANEVNDTRGTASGTDAAGSHSFTSNSYTLGTKVI